MPAPRPWFLGDYPPLPRPARTPTRREVAACIAKHLPAARERLAKGHGTSADRALVAADARRT